MKISVSSVAKKLPPAQAVSHRAAHRRTRPNAVWLESGQVNSFLFPNSVWEYLSAKLSFGGTWLATLSDEFRTPEGVAALLKDGQVDVPPHLSNELTSPTGVDRWIHRNLMRTPWVVYSQPPFGGPEKVLEYLSLYTHRTAIGNERILSYDGTHVCFRWKDRRNDDAVRTSRIPADEFLQRFASHILPNRFQRIRHFGLLANRGKTERLNLCRKLMGIRHLNRSRNAK